MELNVLAVGDVVSQAGLDFLERRLPRLKRELGVHFTVVNGENAGTMVIDDTNNGQSVSLDISGDLLNEGANVITLQSELWSASTVNPADVRLLGIPLKNLEFAAA